MSTYYTCEEVAEMFKVKNFTVWGWIRKKKLPAVKIGRDYRIRPEDVKTFEKARETISIKWERRTIWN